MINDNKFSYVFRQTALSSGGPGGPDPCLEIFKEIIELLNVVADRRNQALDDKTESL